MMQAPTLTDGVLPGIVFHAAAEQEPFTDIRIVTLRTHKEDVAFYNTLHYNSIQTNINVPSGNNEFIQIYEDSILIGLDRSSIDDDATNDAIALLFQLEDFTPGTTIEYNTNETIKFN